MGPCASIAPMARSSGDRPTNRTSNELTEIDDGLSIVESFSHVYTLRTDDGLVCVDASSAFTGAKVVASLRGWSDDRSTRSCTPTATSTTSAGGT
jgi:hypothetical protein